MTLKPEEPGGAESGNHDAGEEGSAGEKTVNAQPREARRTDAVINALRALIRDSVKDRFGVLPEGKILDLSFNLKVRPDRQWDLAFTPPLTEQLRMQVEKVEADWNVYQAGRVYCFRCLRSDCDHGSPGSPMEVFQGYDPMGCPRWNQLAQVLLDLGDERVDLLFETPPWILSRVVYGRELRAGQLRPFGRSSGTYAILGQVIAGYFPAEFGTGDTRERLALTFQAVSVQDGQGRTSLQLNTICALAGETAVTELFSARFPQVLHARDQAKAAIAKLEERARQHELKGDGPGVRRVLSRVPAVLGKLAAALIQGARQTRRRTRHAQERRDLRRPVHKAMDDLRLAQPERLFLDRKTKAIAVCGSKGRCHIFNEEGRHITSFTIDSEAIEGRLRKRRWAPLSTERSHEFLQRVLDLPWPGPPEPRE